MENHKDPWKEFVSNNRSEFDSKNHSDLWKNIESKLSSNDIQKPKVIELSKVYRYAAAVVILFGVVFWQMNNYYSSSSKSNVQTANRMEQPTHSERAPNYIAELEEVETYYTDEIQNRLEELSTIEDNNIVLKEIELLKNDFDALKEEMGDHVNDERVLRAMIKNYRLRLQLLNEVLNEVRPESASKKSKIYGNNKI